MSSVLAQKFFFKTLDLPLNWNYNLTEKAPIKLQLDGSREKAS